MLRRFTLEEIRDKNQKPQGRGEEVGSLERLRSRTEDIVDVYNSFGSGFRAGDI